MSSSISPAICATTIARNRSSTGIILNLSRLISDYIRFHDFIIRVKFILRKVNLDELCEIFKIIRCVPNADF